jgi:hypothetical protein
MSEMKQAPILPEGNDLNEENDKETMNDSNKRCTDVAVDNEVNEMSLGQVDSIVNVNVTIDNKPVELSDFPNIGGKNQVAYGNVTMPGKLYSKDNNIVDILERKLMSDFKISSLWEKWLKNLDLKQYPLTKYVCEFIIAERHTTSAFVGDKCAFDLSPAHVHSIFADYDGKRKMKNELLQNTDRFFLHWLVSPSNFGLVTGVELKFYVKHAQCYEETIRLAQKYHTGDIVMDDIAKYKNTQARRKISEICIFISHFFGRAEVVMDEGKVQHLWNSLPFVNDLLKTLEKDCKKMKTMTKKRPVTSREKDSTRKCNYRRQEQV